MTSLIHKRTRRSRPAFVWRHTVRQHSEHFAEPCDASFADADLRIRLRAGDQLLAVHIALKLWYANPTAAGLAVTRPTNVSLDAMAASGGTIHRNVQLEVRNVTVGGRLCTALSFVCTSEVRRVVPPSRSSLRAVRNLCR